MSPFQCLSGRLNKQWHLILWSITNGCKGNPHRPNKAGAVSSVWFPKGLKYLSLWQRMDRSPAHRAYWDYKIFSWKIKWLYICCVPVLPGWIILAHFMEYLCHSYTNGCLICWNIKLALCVSLLSQMSQTITMNFICIFSACSLVSFICFTCKVLFRNVCVCIFMSLHAYTSPCIHTFCVYWYANVRGLALRELHHKIPNRFVIFTLHTRSCIAMNFKISLYQAQIQTDSMTWGDPHWLCIHSGLETCRKKYLVYSVIL